MRTCSTKKRAARRVQELRDAALMIKATVEGWQGGDVTMVQRGPFRIAYRTYPLTSHGAKTPKALKPSRFAYALTIAAKDILLEIVWHRGNDVQIEHFERGSWETEFLRLQSPLAHWP
jgi:hypothetical protein